MTEIYKTRPIFYLFMKQFNAILMEIRIRKTNLEWTTTPKTNLVTDTRVKRFIRDYLKTISKEESIFVDMEGELKVKYG